MAQDTSDTGPPMDTGQCPVATQTACTQQFFPVDGRVEERTDAVTGLGFIVCVATATAEEGCQRFFGTCPQTAEEALALHQFFCEDFGESVVDGRPLRSIACAVPAVGELGAEDYQYHDVQLYYDDGRLVAVKDYYMPLLASGWEYPCCSNGGVSRRVLWADIPFWECLGQPDFPK